MVSVESKALPLIIDLLNERVWLRRLVVLIVGFVLSVMVWGVFLRYPGMNSSSRARAVDLVYGRAWRPYVQRVALPAIARLIASAVPDAARNALRQDIEGHQRLREWFQRHDWELDYAVEYAVVALLVYACLVGFVFAFRYLLTAVYTGSGLLLDAAPLVALAFIPSMFRYVNYIYDPPTLLLFTLGLAFMVRRQWLPFAVLFPIACLNKETTILLTLVFYIHFRREERLPKARFRFLLAYQVVVFAAVKGFLALLFADNAGAMVEFHLVYNLLYALAPQLWTTLSYFIVALLVLRNWSAKPAFLRDASWILLPLTVLCLFFGFAGEIRAAYDAYPIVVLLGMPTAFGLVGVEMVPLEEPAGRLTSSAGRPAGRGR